jgi:ribosomal protein L11 methyltransferase
MYSLSIQSTPENMDKIQTILYQRINWGWEEKDQDTVLIHFPKKDLALNFKKNIQNISPDYVFQLRPVQDTDWSLDWKKYFTPIEIHDTFIILPEWLESTPSDLIKIIITPKMAFGTGHHPTTNLCLKTLSSLFKQGKLNKDCSFLDLGTGSGILGIAAAKLGLTGLGIDIDSCAVDNARENIFLNKVEDRFEVRTGGVQDIEKNPKYNLIFANILASTLKSLAAQIISLLNKDTHCLILSGILSSQTDHVAQAYMRLGLDQPCADQEKEWKTLVWTHNCG